MSDISVSYDISYSPNPIGASLDLSINGNTAKVSINHVPALAVTATPHYSANIGADILSTIGTPLVNAVTLCLGGAATSLLQGKTFDVYTLSSYTLSIANASVRLTPANLQLSNYNGMLMVTGDLTLS